jgi:hypothetical protein
MTERPDDGSRVEAEEAEIHAELTESPVALRLHHHHPVDPNVGVVRGRTGRGALIAAVAAAAVTIIAVVLLALAVRGGS